MIIAQYTECPSPLFFPPQVKPSSIINIFISRKKNFHTNHQFGIGQDIKTHYKNLFFHSGRLGTNLVTQALYNAII